MPPQFHDYVAEMVRGMARMRALAVPMAVLQPVAPAEVAAAVAEAVERGPLGGRVEVAGPDVSSGRDLALAWRQRTGSRAVLVPFPLPGKLGRAARRGADQRAARRAESRDVRGLAESGAGAVMIAAEPGDIALVREFEAPRLLPALGSQIAVPLIPASGQLAMSTTTRSPRHAQGAVSAADTGQVRPNICPGR